MKRVYRAAAIASALLNIGFSQTQPDALQRFADKSPPSVVWSKEIGRIDTQDAQAVITAVTLKGLTRTPRQMSGVRFDITDHSGSVRVS
jgi:hypothetical protein